MKIIIGGGSGFVGKYLQKLLIDNQCDVFIISRKKRHEKCLTWDEIQLNGLPECDAVINLAGENLMNVFSRWNENFRNVLISSRIDTTKLLANSIVKSKKRPLAWISSSAIGYYPPSSTAEYTEESPGGSGNFMAELCRDWEQAAILPSEVNNVRHAIIRIGLVLGKDGGMIGNMKVPFKAGLGGRLGSGTQYMPWIHIQDVTNLFYHVLVHQQVSGVLNAVAPGCVTNEQFTNAFAKALNKPAVFPVPAFALNLLYGNERAEAILSGQKVIPKRSLECGYKFKYATIGEACEELCR